jgi:N-acetylglutamate synthase-like GNAT family acetyltransferase
MTVDDGSFTLRRARQEDETDIRRLIRQVGINPLGLHWERFLLAVDAQGAMIGCGQIKIHSDGSRELASIAVAEAWRRRGVARAIIRRLMASQDGRLYLTCRSELGPFYRRFGFREAARNELSPYFRRLSKLAGWLGAFHLMPQEGLLIMRWDP